MSDGPIVSVASEVLADCVNVDALIAHQVSGIGGVEWVPDNSSPLSTGRSVTPKTLTASFSVDIEDASPLRMLHR